MFQKIDQMQVPLSSRLSRPESWFFKLIGSGGGTGEEIQYCFALGKNDLFASCSILELDPACDARLWYKANIDLPHCRFDWNGQVRTVPLDDWQFWEAFLKLSWLTSFLDNCGNLRPFERNLYHVLQTISIHFSASKMNRWLTMHCPCRAEL